ncbi:MAG: hemerythrin domain-containing protein [Rubrivivax sp.]|nr:hemerythrin domain-containing protein [Rubrivivax sp.]MBK7263383.1 hemerythrin domain-containing protein [Rubrivivax sp.]
MTTAASMHASPDAGFDQPFAMLSACHERLYRMLQLLERLAAHLPDNGCDPHAVGAARDLTRYFDVAAPAHHEDEERHVLPALRAAGDDAFAAQLEQEHHEMRRRWAELRANLALVIDRSWCDAAVGAGFDHWRQFATLYRAHTASEEEHAFPGVRAALDADAQRAMGREMAARRGLSI